MKGRVPTCDHLYHISSLLMARKYLSLFKNDSTRTIMVVRFFCPIRVSESKSMRRKAATIEKVIESVKQAVISSHIWSESMINKD